MCSLFYTLGFALSRIEKLIEKMENSNKNIDFSTIDKVLNSIGYTCNKKNKGSHYIYKKDDCEPMCIPKHKPVKPVYVDMVIKAYNLNKNKEL